MEFDDSDGEYNEEPSSYFSKKTGFTQQSGITQMMKGSEKTKSAFRKEEQKMK